MNRPSRSWALQWHPQPLFSYRQPLFSPYHFLNGLQMLLGVDFRDGGKPETSWSMERDQLRLGPSLRFSTDSHPSSYWPALSMRRAWTRLHSPPHALGSFCHQSRWQISRSKHRITTNAFLWSRLGHKIDDEHDEDDLTVKTNGYFQIVFLSYVYVIINFVYVHSLFSRRLEIGLFL